MKLVKVVKCLFLVLKHSLATATVIKLSYDLILVKLIQRNWVNETSNMAPIKHYFNAQRNQDYNPLTPDVH